MSILAGGKVFADLCILLAAASALGLWPWSLPALLPPALCALGAGLGCAGREKLPVRLLGLLPGCLGLLCAGSVPRAVIPAAAAAYTALLILQKRFDLEHGAYSRYFLRGLIPLGALLLFSLLGETWRGVLFYGGLYALAGVFLLRQLRLGRRDWQSHALNLTALLAVTAGGGALFAVLLALSRLGFVLGWVWEQVAVVLEILLLGVVWLMSLLWPLLQQMLSLLGVRPREAGPSAVVGAPPKTEPYPQPAEQNPAVLSILLAAAVVLAAVCFVRRGLARMGGPGGSGGRRTVLERMDSRPGPARDIPGPGRGSVRRSYRRFLRLMHRRGAQLSRTQTTEEIHRSVRHLTEETAAGQLRELYLSARYDERAEITPQQARRARELVKKLEKEFSRQPEKMTESPLSNQNRVI